MHIVDLNEERWYLMIFFLTHERDKRIKYKKNIGKSLMQEILKSFSHKQE